MHWQSKRDYFINSNPEYDLGLTDNYIKNKKIKHLKPLCAHNRYGKYEFHFSKVAGEKIEKHLAHIGIAVAWTGKNDGKWDN